MVGGMCTWLHVGPTNCLGIMTVCWCSKCALGSQPSYVELAAGPLQGTVLSDDSRGLLGFQGRQCQGFWNATEWFAFIDVW